MDINYNSLQPRSRLTSEEHAETDVDTGPVVMPFANAGNEFELELECQRQFGHENFSFYCPEIVGKFVVTLYSLSSSNAVGNLSARDSSTSNIYAAIIYEDGEQVDFSKDKRFKSCGWVNRQRRPCDHKFNRSGLIQVMKDLQQIFDKAVNEADKAPATYRRVKIATGAR